jgi:small subunit ribosomal protein S6
MSSPGLSEGPKRLSAGASRSRPRRLNRKEKARMALYEHVFLARQEITQSQVEALLKEYSECITEGGGTVGKIEYWGLKNLAYKIKKNRKAHFALMNIDAPPAAVAEMERRQSCAA